MDQHDRARAQVRVEIADPSQVGSARRAAAALAADLGMAEARQGEVALVATELARNLLAHAGGGALILGTTGAADGSAEAGVEVLSIDRGPGMADIERCLRDGYSTAGTSGVGLGAVRRIAEDFDVFSVPEAGTVIRARIGPPIAAPLAIQVGAVCLPKPGEAVCGDAWAATCSPAGARVLVVDGLGHGPPAAEAAQVAVDLFHGRGAGLPPGEFLRAVHEALRGSRGAVLLLASLDLATRQLRYAGVGNIAGSVLARGGERRGLMSHNGTLGHIAPRVREEALPFPEGATLLLHSDGLRTGWDLAGNPGLLARHPALAVAVLYRDFTRGRDDVTVVAMQDRGGSR